MSESQNTYKTVVENIILDDNTLNPLNGKLLKYDNGDKYIITDISREAQIYREYYEVEATNFKISGSEYTTSSFSVLLKNLDTGNVIETEINNMKYINKGHILFIEYLTIVGSLTILTPKKILGLEIGNSSMQEKERLPDQKFMIIRKLENISITKEDNIKNVIFLKK